MKKKILSLTLVVCLLAIAVVGGTLAYFTDYTDVTSNTFTVGNVDITLDEAKVDVYGVKDGDVRQPEGEGNEYKLIPGHTYVKDPTVTVVGGSEPAYVRMLVTFNKADVLTSLMGVEVNGVKTFLPQNFVAGWDADKWVTTNIIKQGTNEKGEATLTYEFRYYEVVDALGADVIKTLKLKDTKEGEEE